MIVCKIDNTEHETTEALHAYLRRFKIKQADYYTYHYPRFDKLTKEPIPFKNFDQYISQDFVDKRNMKKWLKTSGEEGKVWAIDWLKKRKEKKGLVYAPSQVELRSISAPPMEYYDLIGGYYNIAKSLGFIDRYTNEELVFVPLKEKTKIVEDTREQTPLKLDIKTVSKKLDVADYAIAGKENKGVYIERKSLGDFVGTLNERKIERKKGADSALDRFKRELDRAKENNSYIVMLVEASFSEAISFNYLPQMKWTRATPDHIFHNLRDVLNVYPLNFQAVFVKDREEAAQKLVKIFELGHQVKKVDLQYALDRGAL